MTAVRWTDRAKLIGETVGALAVIVAVWVLYVMVSPAAHASTTVTVTWLMPGAPGQTHPSWPQTYASTQDVCASYQVDTYRQDTAADVALLAQWEANGLTHGGEDSPLRIGFGHVVTLGDCTSPSPSPTGGTPSPSPTGSSATPTATPTVTTSSASPSPSSASGRPTPSLTSSSVTPSSVASSQTPPSATKPHSAPATRPSANSTPPKPSTTVRTLPYTGVAKVAELTIAGLSLLAIGLCFIVGGIVAKRRRGARE